MITALRFGMTCIGLVLIAVAVGGILLVTQLEDPIREFLETQASDVFGAEVEIGTLSWTLSQPGILLEDLRILNPPGFSEKPAFNCESVHFQLRPETMFAEHPAIARMEVTGSQANLDYVLGQGTNLGKLAQNAQDYEARQANLERPFWQRDIYIETFQSDPTELKVLPGVLNLEVPAFSVDRDSADGPVPAINASALFLKMLVKEVVTLRGVVRPVAELLQRESA